VSADPEPLIDRLVADAAVSGSVRLFLRAGLEQARWRGDPAATIRWQQRLDAMLALIQPGALTASSVGSACYRARRDGVSTSCPNPTTPSTGKHVRVSHNRRR
jgi:hypothetical protein